MKKIITSVCLVLMLSMLLSTVCFADEGNYDTLADWNLEVHVPDGTTAVVKGNCYYIYTQHEGYIPYVMITASRYDSGDKFISDFTASMQKQHPDLKVVSEAEKKIIGDKECTEIDYTYGLSGYEVKDRRIILVYDGLTYMFASKEIEARGETVGELLEQVVAECEFLGAGGTDLPGLDDRPALQDAYLYRQEDGMPKYWLDLTGFMADDIVLHCRFRSGDPNWYEAVYILDLDTANIGKRTVEIHKVTDSNGNDVSAWFSKLTVRLFDDHVELVVKRDSRTLAGGGDDNILSGTYRMDPVGAGMFYEYRSEDGMKKYRLDPDGEDLKLRALFISGDPEYYEEVFTLDVDTAEMFGDYALLFKNVYSSKGDVSDRFAFLSLSEVRGAMLMNVKRDEETLAGGAGDNILTGVYLFEPRTYLLPAENGPYSEEELAEWARIRCLSEKGIWASGAEAEKNADGTVTIRLYENTETDGAEHPAAFAWYTVDKYGDGLDGITGETVRLCR